jgi:hypothetical protein
LLLEKQDLVLQLLDQTPTDVTRTQVVALSGAGSGSERRGITLFEKKPISLPIALYKYKCF